MRCFDSSKTTASCLRIFESFQNRRHPWDFQSHPFPRHPGSKFACAVVVSCTTSSSAESLHPETEAPRRSPGSPGVGRLVLHTRFFGTQHIGLSELLVWNAWQFGKFLLDFWKDLAVDRLAALSWVPGSLGAELKICHMPGDSQWCPNPDVVIEGDEPSVQLRCALQSLCSWRLRCWQRWDEADHHGLRSRLTAV